MKAGKIFQSLLERDHYEPDGKMKPVLRDRLKERGYSEEEIANIEKRKKEEIEDRKRFAPRNGRGSSLRDRAIARSGLDVEELLSQGYLDIEDLESGSDPDSFDWEDLL
ncbi:hypothetical protein V0288_12075 [Pannus brasiliensis CCIBt3594]|uniref:Regulatory protein RecX n=1 Tax=Pannus brasiliensis CCIBt3594 TaxID=1427578 RepID=A0AAW9QLQ7_9CHRO